jgi:hypothetical protein
MFLCNGGIHKQSYTQMISAMKSSTPMNNKGYEECRLLGCEALVRADVSEKRTASIIRAIGGLRTTLVRLLVTANVVPSPPILVTLLMEAIRSSKTSALTTATRRHVPEDGILHSHR